MESRRFEIEFTVTTVKKMNNSYAKAFYIDRFEIDEIEQECEQRVSYGYVNFKDAVKKLKRKYNYNKKYDSFYCYEITEEGKKLLKSVSSTEDKMVGTPATFNPGYEGIHRLNVALKNRAPINQDMEEVNFATPAVLRTFYGLLEHERGHGEYSETMFTTLINSMEKKYKGGKIMEGIKNVYINEKEGVTVIVFDNGDKVRVTREKSEKNDVEKAIAIAIVKYYFGLEYYINACDKVVKAEKKEKVKKTAKKADKKEAKI